jgi:hypothetical protein
MPSALSIVLLTHFFFVSRHSYVKKRIFNITDGLYMINMIYFCVLILQKERVYGFYETK